MSESYGALGINAARRKAKTKGGPLDRVAAAAALRGMSYGYYVAAGCPDLKPEETVKTEAKKKAGTKEMTCIICGKKFLGYKKTQRYCSDECKATGNRKTARERMSRLKGMEEPIGMDENGNHIYRRQCIHCGKIFLTDRMLRVYCDDSCKHAEQMERQRRQREAMRK